MKLLEFFAKKHYGGSPIWSHLATEHCGIGSTAPAVGCHILVECDAAAYSWLFLIPVVCRLSGEGDEERCVLQDTARHDMQRKRQPVGLVSLEWGVWLGFKTKWCRDGQDCGAAWVPVCLEPWCLSWFSLH